MSAHKPRPATKVTPRRISPHPEAASAGAQYDSHEVPVLIRLPELSAAPTAEPTAEPAQKHRIDQAESGARRSHSRKSRAGYESKLSSPWNQKLLIGGVLGGALVVGFLFFSNGSGSKQTEDEMAWPDSKAESSQLVQDVEVSIPENGESQPSYDFEYPSLPSSETGVAAHDAESSAPTQRPAPTSTAEPPMPTPPFDNTADHPNASPETWQPGQTPPVQNPEPPSPTAPAQSWPDESVMAGPSSPSPNQGQSATRPHDYRNSGEASGQDHRSSMHNGDHEAYRTSQLPRPEEQAEQDNSENGILHGTIDIPSQTSLR